MNEAEEQAQIKALLGKLGASKSQAEVMSRQLVKRANQWVEERGMSRVEAMKELLDLVVAGRSGQTPPCFEGIEGDKREQRGEF